jgi:DNA-binding IclR family transcriptional regulator
LAHAALRKIGFRPFAEPGMHMLVDEIGLAANLGVLEGGRVLLVDHVESPESISAAVPLPRELRDIGKDLPGHTTGLGKVLLAWLDHDQILEIIKEQGLARR